MTMFSTFTVREWSQVVMSKSCFLISGIVSSTFKMCVDYNKRWHICYLRLQWSLLLCWTLTPGVQWSQVIRIKISTWKSEIMVPSQIR